MAVVSISLPDSLLRRVYEVAASLGYTGRSEFFREAIRRLLDHLESMWGESYRLFVVTVLSDHRVYPASDRRVLEVIHEYQAAVKAFYHQLLGDGLCPNVAVIETSWPLLSRMLKDLRSVKGVLDIQFVGYSFGPR